MRRSGIVIGLGETGGPLYDTLRKAYPDMLGYDMMYMGGDEVCLSVGIMHVCIPYGDDFPKIVARYQAMYTPDVTVIHTTTPIGTTEGIRNAVHSPILGDHTNMRESITSFTKWIGGDPSLTSRVAEHFNKAGIKCREVSDSKWTEMLKLTCLAKYGMSIVFAQYQKELCEQYGMPYDEVILWDENYNDHVDDTKKRPLLSPPGETIGGHCVVQNAHHLNAQHPHPYIREILEFDPNKPQYKAWGVSNIYKSARISDGVNIGTFCEIGPNVSIGKNVRIGAMCFIPECVTIEENAWVGPRVTFTNDRFPPSGKDNWEKTVVKKGARLGAGVIVVCGATIGEGSLVGSGSVVTRDIPPNEIWAGVPARFIRRMDGEKAA
jgi:acetyltransferase-like isoleucine patch superfamily enzyme